MHMQALRWLILRLQKHYEKYRDFNEIVVQALTKAKHCAIQKYVT